MITHSFDISKLIDRFCSVWGGMVFKCLFNVVIDLLAVKSLQMFVLIDIEKM